MKHLLGTWALLLVLMLASLALAYLPLGDAKLAAGLLIAALKALLVARVFMRLGRTPAVLPLCAGAALATWLLLEGLTWLDLLARTPRADT